MKNAPKTGRSAKRGNSAAPYTKYNKRPYSYTAMYQRFPHLAACKRKHGV